MTNWNKPDNSSSKTAVLTELKEMTHDCIKLDHSGASNLPTSAIRYNRTTRVLEEWNGSTYSVLPVADPIGTVKMWITDTAPTGYLFLQGGSIGNAASTATARANADTEQLFTLLWNALADAQAPVSSGRGASAAADFAANKRLTLPDMRQRFPIGKAASGTGSTLGGTGGAIDHVHTGPSHTHDMGNHTHTGPSHTHTIPAHSHDSRASGATISIGASGDHFHSAAGSFALFGAGGSVGSAGGSNLVGANATDTRQHTHPNSSFTGKVGNVNSGNDGDNTMNTGSSGTGNTGAPSTNTTGASGTGNTGTNNPPFLALNFIIKY